MTMSGVVVCSGVIARPKRSSLGECLEMGRIRSLICLIASSKCFGHWVSKYLAMYVSSASAAVSMSGTHSHCRRPKRSLLSPSIKLLHHGA